MLRSKWMAPNGEKGSEVYCAPKFEQVEPTAVALVMEIPKKGGVGLSIAQLFDHRDQKNVNINALGSGTHSISAFLFACGL